MKLVLAEKPSVAQSIAKVLGATKREDGYLEGNGYVVSWCVGHLVELSQPEAYDEKYNKWAYADLPIFPDQWKYQVSASTKKQFGILKKLMARKDVESLVCATDAGREGELIFRLVYQQAGCRKPFERLWISSMEDSAIREGFEQLKPSTEYDALYEAALCRERADWLVGINATRLFSTLYGQTLNVGRVMTPTLAMVVMREAAISAFRPEPFYTVELAFQDFTASGERMKQKVLADDVARKCVGSVLNVTKAENKEKSEKPPALYDLTSLQRDANRVLGFTAQQTLDYTQSLYEKKLVTYPRTDSRYLTSDMKDMLPELIKSLFNIFPVEDVKNVPVHAAQVINDKKVSDHHAIIPTKEAIKCSLDDLPKGEQAILRLIATRLFCAVGEPFRYNESVIELSDGELSAEERLALSELNCILSETPQWSSEEELCHDMENIGGRVRFCRFWNEHYSMVQLTEDRNGKYSTAYVLDTETTPDVRKVAALQAQKELADRMQAWGVSLLDTSVPEQMKYDFLAEAASHLMQVLNDPEHITG